MQDINDPDKIIEVIEDMIDTWSLKELRDFVIEDRTEYYLGENVSKAEVEQLLNDYNAFTCNKA